MKVFFLIFECWKRVKKSFKFVFSPYGVNNEECIYCMYVCIDFNVCDALRDMALFVQFEKRENTLGAVLRLVKLQTLAYNFTKSNTRLLVFFKFVQMVPNRAKHLECLKDHKFLSLFTTNGFIM